MLMGIRLGSQDFLVIGFGHKEQAQLLTAHVVLTHANTSVAGMQLHLDHAFLEQLARAPCLSRL